MFLFFYATGPFLSLYWLTGFEDLVHMGAAVAAMSTGSYQVDGCRPETDRRVTNVGRELGWKVFKTELCSAGWTGSFVWMVEALKAWC